MLPPGHIAAGFLTAKVLLHFSHAGFSQEQQTHLLWWGMLFGFLPDIDVFIAFAKEKAFMMKDRKNNHRKQFTHAPILWFLAGLVVMIIARNAYWRYVGILLWLGSWSHFLLDTVQYGIMWLWPFSKKVYAIKDRERDSDSKEETFFRFWWTFVKQYVKTLSFYLEAIIIISAFIIYFK